MDAQQTIADLITEYGLEETLQAFADAVIKSDEDDKEEITRSLTDIIDDFFEDDSVGESEDDED